jgi:pSer/pThr/pTyr-binding forkhead associated (FHA) protein
MALLESTGFVLAVKGRHLELDGSVTVGRSTTCDVVLHRDEEASRLHARFFLDRACVFVQDLGSTNGTFVGGERVVGNHPLRVGDVVRVGSSLITLGLPQATSQTRAAELSLVDHRPSATSFETTRPADVFEVLERVVSKAVDAGRAEEGETAAGTHLDKLLAEVRHGLRDDDHVERAIRIAARLASALPSARWLDYLVEIHSILDRAMEPELVELLCASSEVTRVSPTRLREYCRRMADRSSSLSIRERLSALRLQGLLQSA